jgi:curved DNA-binding protein CbpA
MPSPVNLVETLLKVHNTSRSGVVRLEHGTQKKQVIIRAGRLAFSESNLPEDHLAQILVRMGLLSRSHLAGITSLMKTGKSADAAIIASARLSRQDVEKAVLEQSVLILSSLLGHRNYEIHFYAGDDLVRREVQLDIPLPEILVLAVRRSVKDHCALGFPGLHQGLLVKTSSEGKEHLKFPLNSHEAFAYSLINAPSLAKNLLTLIPAGEAKPEELLQRLLLLGLIRIDTPESSKNTGKQSSSEQDALRDHLENLVHAFEIASLYEILSVPADATEDQVKEAYHKLAKQYHPDHFQSKEHGAAIRKTAERLFTYITGAYATLGDPALRASYDETRIARDSRVEATLQARAAVEVDKEKMAEALFVMGRSAFQNGDYAKAVEHLKECVWLRPDVAKFHHYLGSAQAEIPKHRKEAERHFLRVLELDRTAVATRIALGKLYLRVNLPRRAEAQFREALRWEPGNPEASGLLYLNIKQESGGK